MSFSATTTLQPRGYSNSMKAGCSPIQTGDGTDTIEKPYKSPRRGITRQSSCLIKSLNPFDSIEHFPANQDVTDEDWFGPYLKTTSDVQAQVFDAIQEVEERHDEEDDHDEQRGSPSSTHTDKSNVLDAGDVEGAKETKDENGSKPMVRRHSSLSNLVPNVSSSLSPRSSQWARMGDVEEKTDEGSSEATPTQRTRTLRRRFSSLLRIQKLPSTTT